MPKNIETLAIHAGRKIDPATGAVVAPIHLSTTFERDADGSYSRGFSYSRELNPTRQALESCLAALEGGMAALAFSSGLAAATAVIHTLSPGDHIVAPDDMYHGFRKLLNGLFSTWKIGVDYVDMAEPENVRRSIRPSTRLIWTETPSNPLLKLTDLSAIAVIARQSGVLMACDSTFATPVLQNPFVWGADLVLHSTTKYISGHSDVTGGALVVREANEVYQKLRSVQSSTGAVPSPFDCYMTLRGIETLPCRVRALSTTALAIAEYLAQHRKVEKVLYPGLSDHPGHEIAKRQMSGFGGMLSFEVKGGAPEAMHVASEMQLFTRATSLGGTHSLIEHRASIEGPSSTTPQNLLRLSIGLEHPDDLIADLEQGLNSI